MSDSEDRRYNRLFKRRFRFRPGTNPKTWPAIREPYPSVTVELVTDRADDDTPVDLVNTLALEAMQETFPSSEALLALDPYGTSCWFWPHWWSPACSDDEWYITPWPGGEYSIFLTVDMSVGMFGHPWEQTLCIFGDPLLRLLAPQLLAFQPVKRDRRP